jgi:uncharacterized protein YbjT (DUF2867 family)
MSKKVIAVVGATGAQGGGLVRAILADHDGPFAARAVVRDPSSEKARALAALGAEVVAGDVDDEASLERAFAGAHGVYCVTFFWAHFSPEKELQHAKNMATAAKAAHVQHVVWSTLEDTRTFVPLTDNRMPTLQGKYKVPHFDAKGEADALFAGLPTTYLLTAFYWENFIYFGLGPKRGGDGKLSITLPLGDAKMPSIGVEDIGRSAYGIFKRGKEMIGKRVGIAGDHVSGADMAAGLSKQMGEEVRYNAIEPAAFRGLGFPGAEDLGNMFQFYRDFEKPFRASRDLAASKQINPALQNWQQWLEANSTRIPLS